MRIITETFKVYTFKEASKELRDKIRNEFSSDSWLYEHNMQERIDTLKKLAEILDGELNYCLSEIPDRNEFIKISPKDGYVYNESLDFDNLWKVISQEKDCPFTGVCYDHDIIDHFTKYNLNMETLNNALTDYIESIHKEYESMLEDDYLIDLCEANKYEFTEDGKIFN